MHRGSPWLIAVFAATKLACGLGCGSGTSGGASCEDSAIALAKRIEPSADFSTLVARLDYRSRQVLAWHYFTDASSGPVTEDVAQGIAAADTGGFAGLPSVSLSGAGAIDEFVFYASAGDLGGESAVSVRTGHTVFGGSIGPGGVTYPKTWSAPDELSSVCFPAEPPPPSRGIAPYPLDSNDVAAALAAAWNTAIPGALSKSRQTALDAVLLYYTPTHGGDERVRAQWIVIINVARMTAGR